MVDFCTILSDMLLLAALHAQLIYPANENIIAKYRFEEKFIIQETAEDYKTITLPWIESNQLNLKVSSLLFVVLSGFVSLDWLADRPVSVPQTELVSMIQIDLDSGRPYSDHFYVCNQFS